MTVSAAEVELDLNYFVSDLLECLFTRTLT